MNKQIRGVGDQSACGGCWSLPGGQRNSSGRKVHWAIKSS